MLPLDMAVSVHHLVAAKCIGEKSKPVAKVMSYSRLIQGREGFSCLQSISPSISELPELMIAHDWRWDPPQWGRILPTNAWTARDPAGREWIVKMRGSILAYQERTFAAEEHIFVQIDNEIMWGDSQSKLRQCKWLYHGDGRSEAGCMLAREVCERVCRLTEEDVERIARIPENFVERPYGNLAQKICTAKREARDFLESL